MTRPDWPGIKNDYVESSLTLAEVQAKWCVPRGTLSARSTRENWNEQKQQFAAKLETMRREKNIAKRAAEQVEFDGAILAIARGQLGLIARHVRDEGADAAKVLKLANALETLQRIGSSAFGGSGSVARAPCRNRADDPRR